MLTRVEHGPRRDAWTLTLDVSANEPTPLFVRIARAISADIRRGRLAPQTRLPGSRVLASSLKVHRNTVLAAYRELFAQGWIEARHGEGTFVSSQLPESESSPRQPRAMRTVRTRPGFDFRPPSDAEPISYRSLPKQMLRLFGGTPDMRLLPHAEFARAQRRALRESTSSLEYGDPAGSLPLRAALAGMLRSARGLLLEPDDLLITRGSQMAISLAARAILRPGDVVAVESYGYRPAFCALKLPGVRLIPIPVDAQGLQVERLAELCAREPVRAVYVTPHHQYPTTVPLAPGRRLELLALATRARFAILEDDYDHEYHYEGRPLLPLASADDAGVVIYFGTLSKVFAPGIRIGYVVAPRPVLAEMTRLRFFFDRQGDLVTECAIAELIEEGELQRHVRRMRRIYQLRRETCAAQLRQQLGAALGFELPNGGLALWARVASGIDVSRWSEAAEAQGVAIQAGRQFRFDDKPCPYIRIGYAALNEAELVEAIRRLKRALPVSSRTATR